MCSDPVTNANVVYLKFFSFRFLRNVFFCWLIMFVWMGGALPVIGAQGRLPIIAITQIVEHPSADKTREGVLDALREASYVDGKTIKVVYDNAQGNMTTAVQIAKKFVSMKPDVIVPITTPSAQTVAAATKTSTIPVVFASVTDPLHAKIVQDLKRPGGNITGTSEYPPIAKQMELIKEMLPNVKSVGMIYNPGETNSVKIYDLVKAELQAIGIRLYEATAVNTNQVPSAAQALVGKVDAVYISLDNNVLSAMDSVLKIMNKHKIPVFTSDPDSVRQGVLASLSYTQYEAGRLAGAMIIRILQGDTPGDIPVMTPENAQLHINMQAADALGISIPDGLKARAQHILN